MYGTTRSTEREEPSRRTYIFRIGILGGSKDLDPNDVTMKEVDETNSDLGLEAYFTGIRVKDDAIHLVYYQGTDHSLWYTVLDFDSPSVTTTILEYREFSIGHWGSTWFNTFNDSTETVNGIPGVYQAYSAFSSNLRGYF